jgi:endonuclease/exonuclease/phosphatase family metal-dependent hydrolase
VVSWNIEFGYALDAVAAELERLDADVICLQEVDRFDDRRRGGAQKDVFFASRLFPMHCTDSWRWRLCAFPCLRMSEAELWQRLLFHSGCRYSHLSDPFDKRSDTTLRAFSAAPLSLLNSAFDAKLDWMLLSAELAAQSHRVVRSAAVDAASDHRPLLCEVVLTHC